MEDPSPPRTVDPETTAAFHRDGYTIIRNLFTAAECDRYSAYFTAMVERGGDGYAENPVNPADPDPLKRYPRLLQPHRTDAVAFSYMTDARLRSLLTALLHSKEPLAVQTMVYFKPPQARGQALHQDNMYLLARPGTCVAAWLALDDCNEENGCMVFCPNTTELPILCQTATPGLEQEHWQRVETPRPPGCGAPLPAVMEKGDVVVFLGNVIHGSFRNRSEHRFRRSLIAHYVEGEAQAVAKYYFPVYRMDGNKVEGIEESAGGGPCGVVEEGGRVDMTGTFKAWDVVH